MHVKHYDSISVWQLTVFKRQHTKKRLSNLAKFN